MYIYIYTYRILSLLIDRNTFPKILNTRILWSQWYMWLWGVFKDCMGMNSGTWWLVVWTPLKNISHNSEGFHQYTSNCVALLINIYPPVSSNMAGKSTIRMDDFPRKLHLHDFTWDFPAMFDDTGGYNRSTTKKKRWHPMAPPGPTTPGTKWSPVRRACHGARSRVTERGNQTWKIMENPKNHWRFE